MKQSIEGPHGRQHCPVPKSIAGFVEAVESQRPYIFRFLLASTCDVDLAETLTQECFLRAYRHWADFRGNSRIATWLIRIAINLQRDYWRSPKTRFWRQVHKNTVDPHDAEQWLSSSGSSPEAQFFADERLRQIWEIVDVLREKYRTVFLLRYVEGLSLREIAKATGMREGTVKSYLFRAVDRIRSELKARDSGRRSLAQTS